MGSGKTRWEERVRIKEAADVSGEREARRVSERIPALYGARVITMNVHRLMPEPSASSV